jgi:hypothetical protein
MTEREYQRSRFTSSMREKHPDVSKKRLEEIFDSAWSSAFSIGTIIKNAENFLNWYLKGKKDGK